jgi:hypothetical protein
MIQWLRSAKAAFGGAKRSGTTADSAAGSESVLREFLRSAKAADRASVIRQFRSRLGWASAPLILLLISMGFCWKLVLSDQYTWLESPDFAYQVLPWLQFEATEFHAHSIPLWDPYQWNGQPLIGQAQPGVVNPINWLLFSAPLRHGWIRQSAMHWYYLLIHFIGALGCYLLCRDLGRHRSSSIIAGFIFAFGGWIGTTDWPQMLSGGIWTPLVFLFLLRAIRGFRPISSACLSGMFLGIAWLSGHHQAPIFISLAATGTWLWFSWQDRRLIRYAALFFVFTGLTSALQTLPTLEYARLSRRWVGINDPTPWNVKVPYLVHNQYSTTPATVLGIIFPGLEVHSDPYIGAIAFALALLAVAIWFKWPIIRLFLFLGIAGFLVSYGGNLGYHGILYALLPNVDKARTPAMALLIFSFSFSVLTAYGIDALREHKPAQWIQRITLVFSGIAVLVLGFTLCTAILGKSLTEERVITASITGLIGAAVMFGYVRNQLTPRTMSTLIGILIYGQLTLTFGFLWPSRYEKERNPYLHKMSENADLARYLRSRPQPLRVDVDSELIPYNFGDWYGVETTNGYLASLTENVLAVPTYEHRMQNMLAVGYYIGAKPRFDDQQMLYQGAHDLNIYLNPGVNPRAWTVHKTKVVQYASEIGSVIMDPINDLRQVALVLKGNKNPENLETCPGSENTAITRHRASEVWIEATLQCRGLVILADTYYPGWKAWIDGKPAPIWEVDGMLRGVVAEKGAHKIEMRYQPNSVRLGAFLTALGILGAVGLAGSQRRVVNPPGTPESKR